MRPPTAAAIAAFAIVFGLASSTAAADVQLTIQNGRITLIAKDATLRQILAEWAKVGQTKIVNGERAPGGPISIQLTNVPEQQALDMLLRSLSGYVVSPRDTPAANLSQFDRILIMATLAPPPGPTTAAPSTPPPVFPQPGVPGMSAGPFFPSQGQPIADDQDDERPAPNRNPMFQTFPPPQVVNPTQGMPSNVPGVVAPPNGPLVLPSPVPMPTTTPAVNAPAPAAAYPGGPTAPAGVAVPGMIVPVPQQPGQPGQPTQPAKRPGGL